jgi:universal stress protein A
MLPIRTIIYPTDFSRRSEYAFHLACALARDYGARMILAHVKAPPVVMGEFGAVPAEPPGYLETLKAELANYRPTPNIEVERIVVEGDPAVEIARLAKEHKADLIVMGTHGRSGLGRLLIGSVAEAVLRKAPCPVLTIKTPMTEAEPVAAKPAEKLCPT